MYLAKKISIKRSKKANRIEWSKMKIQFFFYVTLFSCIVYSLELLLPIVGYRTKMHDKIKWKATKAQQSILFLCKWLCLPSWEINISDCSEIPLLPSHVICHSHKNAFLHSETQDALLRNRGIAAVHWFQNWY